MNVFVLVILTYLIYRFIAGFVAPLLRGTRQMRQHFNDMNGKNPANPQAGPEEPVGPGTTQPKSSSSKVGEYIDFEES